LKEDLGFAPVEPGDEFGEVVLLFDRGADDDLVVVGIGNDRDDIGIKGGGDIRAAAGLAEGLLELGAGRAASTARGAGEEVGGSGALLSGDDGGHEFGDDLGVGVIEDIFFDDDALVFGVEFFHEVGELLLLGGGAVVDDVSTEGIDDHDGPAGGC